MSTETQKPSLYQRHPQLKLSREGLNERNRRLRLTLQKFMDEGNESEQRETGAFLMEALAETRESSREAKLQ